MLLALLAACGNDHRLDLDADLGGRGLPCDVQTMLSERCDGCHGNQLAGGATIRIVDYDDLVRTTKDGVTIAAEALARMKLASSPMPPSPAVASASDIAILENWITAGMPRGECMGGGGPFDVPPTCTSGRYWTGGNRESPLMHPGMACIQCHTDMREGPRFKIAGSVYPTGHEPNDCNGATSATIEVTDAGNRVTNLAVNAAGNFSSQATFTFPIRVAVVANGKRRDMIGAPASGDCNTCHTQNGAMMAPGRIVVP
jgi:hypothetical protein